MSTTTTERESDGERPLAQQLQDVEMATTDGGVESVVTDVRDHGGRLCVEFQLPSGATETEFMAKPQRNDESYKFVRVCKQAGATISTYEDLLVGATVEAEKGDGGWQIAVPDHTTRKERVVEVFEHTKWGIVFAGALAVLPLTLVAGHIEIVRRVSENKYKGTGDMLFLSVMWLLIVGGLGGMAWLLAVGTVAAIL